MQNFPLALKSFLFPDHWTAFWLPFVITGLSCPLLIRWAPIINLFDHPRQSPRKIHHQIKPLGGTAILLGFIPLMLLNENVPISLILPVLVVLFTGLIDDIKGLNPKPKLFLHVLAAILLVTFHPIPPTNLDIFVNLKITVSGVPNLFLVGFWLVGAINSFNLIDGLDGLATGIGIISLLPLMILTFGQDSFTVIGGLVSGLIAILIYNFYPAKLFLGDGGSYLLGFLVAYLVIVGLSTPGVSSNGWSLTVGLLLLGIPIIDTVLAILRRAKSKGGIMEADQNHLHHKLYRSFGHAPAVLIVYLIQVALSGLALLITF